MLGKGARLIDGEALALGGALGWREVYPSADTAIVCHTILHWELAAARSDAVDSRGLSGSLVPT